jgi:hypothetical protein
MALNNNHSLYYLYTAGLCHDYNGGCSHWCMAFPPLNFYVCGCPTNYQLNDNKRTCSGIVSARLCTVYFIVFHLTKTLLKQKLGTCKSSCYS